MIERYSRAEMKEIWTEEAKYGSWESVEKAHLETLVERSEAPASVLKAFDDACKTKNASDFLRREIETNHDVIAFIAELADAMGDEGRFLHMGLTSSDVLDTSLSLRVRKALRVILGSLARTREAFAFQAFTHAYTPCVGRTHGIHAEPMSFGQVLASHAAEFQRAHHDVLTALQVCNTGKISGAVGTWSQLPPDFEARLLAKLGLEPETVATQVLPRDRLVRVGQALVNVANAVERFSVNLRHWARTELGEVLEPFSQKQKGSSAMPHKRNPVLAENLTGLARTVRGYAQMLTENNALWHERDISHSSVERMALPDIFVTADFLLDRTAKLVQGMVVRPEVMMANLMRTGGLWCSQSVLTSLVDRGMQRTEAYEMLQRIALPIAERSALGAVKENEFLEGLQKEKRIVEILGQETLKKLFVLDRFLMHVPLVFRRVFGMTPEDFAGTAKELPLSARIPTLQKIYKVTVGLLPDVLDTEAKTIENDFHAHGGNSVSLRIQRSFILRLPNEKSVDSLRDYAKDVLQNAVIEQMQIEEMQ
jgi:adenylosuccinate lyase